MFRCYCTMQIADSVAEYMQPGELLYISTDEKDHKIFAPLAKVRKE